MVYYLYLEMLRGFWSSYCWYFKILSILMDDVLCQLIPIILWVMYHRYLEILSIFMVNILLILCDTKNFDDVRTLDTYTNFVLLINLRYVIYLIFLLLMFCWYYKLRGVLVFEVLMVLWDTKYFDIRRTIDIYTPFLLLA